MPSRSRRSYDQFCAIARALDSVGDRWTLLIVRELLAGPRRYTDLHADLPGVSTDVLASRLKHMEGEGLAERRRQPRPAAGYVYELTPRGRALLPVLTALATWGGPELGAPHPTDAVRAHWWAIPLRTAVRETLRATGVADAGDMPDVAEGEGGAARAEGAAVDAGVAGEPAAHAGGAEPAVHAGGAEPAAYAVDVRVPGGTFHVRFGGGVPYGEGPAPERAAAALELGEGVGERLAAGAATLAAEIGAGAVTVSGAGPVAAALRGTS